MSCSQTEMGATGGGFGPPVSSPLPSWRNLRPRFEMNNVDGTRIAKQKPCTTAGRPLSSECNLRRRESTGGPKPPPVAPNGLNNPSRRCLLGATQRSHHNKATGISETPRPRPSLSGFVWRSLPDRGDGPSFRVISAVGTIGQMVVIMSTNWSD
jgi:hypothetical protein